MSKISSLINALQKSLQSDTLHEDERSAVSWLLTAIDNGSVNLSVEKSTEIRPKSKPKVVRMDVVEKHAAALKAAKNDSQAFAIALESALNDAQVRTEELRELAFEYSGRRPKAKDNRSDIERQIRQAQSRNMWQDSAYKRIEKITAAE